MSDVRRGAQRPRLANVPLGVRSDGEDATALAAVCGLILDPWQAYALDCLLQQKSDGRWRTKTGLLVVPRQNGKGAVLEAWELFRLLSLDVREVRHTAHHAKTAKDAFEKMRFRIKSSELLNSRLANDRSGGIRTANGEWGFTFKTGQKLTYTTRTEGIGRGETLSDIVVDEAQHLSDAEMGAISFTMATKPYGQMLLTGSAPIPGKSEVMERLITAGRNGSETMTYLEWSVDERADVDLDDRGLWAAANPGYGIRLLDDEILNEREANSPEVFARERLGIVRVGESAIFPAGAWERLKEPHSTISTPQMFAVEVEPDHDWSCIGAAGPGPAGMHVESVDYRANTGWLLGRARELASRYAGAQFVILPSSPAGSLIADFEAAGLTVVKASPQEYAQACGAFYDAVVGGEIHHAGQAELDVSVKGAKKRTVGDAFAWDRKGGLGIAPLAAVTLAFWGHTNRPPPRPSRWASI